MTADTPPPKKSIHCFPYFMAFLLFEEIDDLIAINIIYLETVTPGEDQ